MKAPPPNGCHRGCSLYMCRESSTLAGRPTSFVSYARVMLPAQEPTVGKSETGKYYMEN